MLCRTIKLLTLLVLLPAMFAQRIEHSRVKRASWALGKPHKNIKNDAGAVPHHLRFRNLPPRTISLSPGESKVLECEAGGNPPPTIHWLKNGRRFNQDTIMVNDIDDGNHDTDPLLGLSFTRSRLYLDCVTEQDAGEYSCVADSPYDRINSKTKVELLDQGDSKESIFCLTKKSYGTPARIHMWTHARLELIGSDVQLFCRVGGKPEPEVEWISPDDVIIKENEKYQILINGDLIIREINWKDMGSYVCISKNIHGNDQTSTFLYPAMPEK